MWYCSDLNVTCDYRAMSPPHQALFSSFSFSYVDRHLDLTWLIPRQLESATRSLAPRHRCELSQEGRRVSEFMTHMWIPELACWTREGWSLGDWKLFWNSLPCLPGLKDGLGCSELQTERPETSRLACWCRPWWGHAYIMRIISLTTHLDVLIINFSLL